MFSLLEQHQLYFTDESGLNHVVTYLQVTSDRLLPFGLGAGQLLPQHLLPHVDGLQSLLDIEEVLLVTKKKENVFT